MIAWRRQRSGAAPAADIQIEDRRGSGDRAPLSRGLARLVVDYRGDHDRCQDVIASLMDEYERYVSREHAVCPGCPVVRSGPFVVYSMLEWKAIYRDGRLGHWTRDDVHEYLLDHFPRKVSVDRRLLRDAPTCVKDLVYFMSDRGTLAGDDLDVLTEAAEEVFDGFLAANRDRRNWGLAKQVLRGGVAVGDEDDDRYVHLVTIPPAGLERPGVKTRSGRQGATAQREKRKAARAARKRNRR